MRRVSMFVLGAVLGGLLGSTVALLLAPTSGNSLRQQVQEYFQQLASEVRSAAATKRLELEQQLSDLRSPAIRVE